MASSVATESVEYRSIKNRLKLRKHKHRPFRSAAAVEAEKRARQLDSNPRIDLCQAFHLFGNLVSGSLNLNAVTATGICSTKNLIKPSSRSSFVLNYKNSAKTYQNARVPAKQTGPKILTKINKTAKSSSKADPKMSEQLTKESISSKDYIKCDFSSSLISNTVLKVKKRSPVCFDLTDVKDINRNHRSGKFETRPGKSVEPKTVLSKGDKMRSKTKATSATNAIQELVPTQINSEAGAAAVSALIENTEHLVFNKMIETTTEPSKRHKPQSTSVIGKRKINKMLKHLIHEATPKRKSSSVKKSFEDGRIKDKNSVDNSTVPITTTVIETGVMAASGKKTKRKGVSLAVKNESKRGDQKLSANKKGMLETRSKKQSKKQESSLGVSKLDANQACETASISVEAEQRMDLVDSSISAAEATVAIGVESPPSQPEIQTLTAVNDPDTIDELVLGLNCTSQSNNDIDCDVDSETPIDIRNNREIPKITDLSIHRSPFQIDNQLPDIFQESTEPSQENLAEVRIISCFNL